MRRVISVVCLALFSAGLTASSANAQSANPPVAALVLLSDPEPTQYQQDALWVLELEVKNVSQEPVLVNPKNLKTIVTATTLSNSRVPGHRAPLDRRIALVSPINNTAEVEMIRNWDEDKRCALQLGLTVWAICDITQQPAQIIGKKIVVAQNGTPIEVPDLLPQFVLLPEAVCVFRFELKHNHVVFGDYELLLGTYAFVMEGEGLAYENTFHQKTARDVQPRVSWPEPPCDRLDARFFITGPNSLHLEAHIPGNGHYRFPERPVRYGTRMRLRYWYMIAPGSEGECRARIAQYKETPTTWKVLSDGCKEEHLTVVGRWVRVETYFRTEPDATTLALDFRVAGADVGEMWIDDVELEPLDDLIVGR